MSWVRIDDRLWCHPKLELLDAMGPATSAGATSLWIRTLSRSAQLGDPRVTLKQARRLMPPKSQVRRFADALAEVGLWDADGPQAWTFHDWADYQGKDRREAKSAPKFERSSDQVQTKFEQSLSKVQVSRGAESLENPDTPVPVPVPVPEDHQPAVAGLVSEGPASPPPSGPDESLLADTRRALRRAWSDAWSQRTASPASSLQLDAVSKLATWCIEYAQRGDDDGPGIGRRVVAAFFEQRATMRRPRVEWLAEDPGRYLEPSERPEAVTAAKRAEARRLDAERAERERLHAATVAREQAEGSVPGVGFDFNALLSGASARRRVDTETHEDRSRARQQSAEERARLIAAQRERLIASLEAAE